MRWEHVGVDDENDVYRADGLHPEVSIVVIPRSALIDRQQLYALGTEAEAVEHIMWEHHIRLNPDAPESVLPPQVKISFDRVWGGGHKAARGLPMTKQEEQDQNARVSAIRTTRRGDGKAR